MTVVLMICAKSFAASSHDSIAASALFDRFEVVFYAKSDIVSAPSTPKGFSDLEFSIFHYPFALLPGALHSLGEVAFSEIFKGSDAILIGAKGFRAPEGTEGLGQVRSNFCYVIILKKNSGVQLRKYFTESESPSASAGSPVWHWSAKLNEFGRDDPRPSSLYFTQVSETYLLVSNDLSNFQDIVGRLASSDQDLQALHHVRDWSSLEGHQFWGYRRYRHADIVNSAAAGTSEVTPGAEALSFFLDFDKRTGVLHLFTSTTDEGTAAKMNARTTLPKFKRDSPGIWEASTRLAGNQDSAEQMFGVMYLFGFGVYL
jgi:hypothetical protein